MTLNERIAAFVQLGKQLNALATLEEWKDYSCGLTETEFANGKASMVRARHENGWFTIESVQHAFGAWAHNLTESNLQQFVAPYAAQFESIQPKTVALVMAGNIPLVSMHDLLCVLLSGHYVMAKFSSQDTVLMKLICNLLITNNPDFNAKIIVPEGKIQGMDAVIATGSDNSARYFDYYFGKYPNIIRKNRTSVAIVDDEATEEEMVALGKDIFTYFGLGCRNVTKIYFPKDFDRDRFFKGLFPYGDVALNAKFANNYDYHKALYLMNQDELLENGFILLKEEEALSAPPGVLFFQWYADRAALDAHLEEHADNIQCIVASDRTPFGKAQEPELNDFADGIDTMAFVAEL